MIGVGSLGGDMNIVWIIPAVLLVLWLIYAIKSRQIKCFLFGVVVLVVVAGASICLTAWGEGWKVWYAQDEQNRMNAPEIATFTGLTVQTKKTNSPDITENTFLSFPGGELICRVITENGRVVSLMPTPIGSDDLHAYGGFRPLGNGREPVLFLDLAENGTIHFDGRKASIPYDKFYRLVMETEDPIYITVRQNTPYSNLLAMSQTLASRTNGSFGLGWNPRYPEIQEVTPIGEAIHHRSDLGAGDIDHFRHSPGSTEYAVLNALNWLVSTQNKDGSWGDGTNSNRAETGMALLAFLGHGETTASYEYGKTVTRGFNFLITEMQATNRTIQIGQPSAIEHAIATWALCEGYNMMWNPALNAPAEEALAVIVKGQRASGLWGGTYHQGEGEDDIEASIWQFIALTSGLKMGSKSEGLRECRERASREMKKLLEAQPPPDATAGLVLCLQLSGKTKTEVFQKTLASLATVVPDWANPTFNDPIFSWNLITQAVFQKGGEPWIRWNRLFAPMLVQNQKAFRDKDGEVIGYWDSPGARERFGRVYSTALSVMMLEVYYRFLPLFYHRQSDEGNSKPTDDEIRIEYD